MRINYNKFVDEIIDYMLLNTDSVDDIHFQKYGNNIGKQIYEIDGYKGLFLIMDMLLEHIQKESYDNCYIKLRELEVSFNEICEEFQM